MKKFSIKVISKPKLEGEYLYAYGQIRIGTFKERFRIAIAEWAVKDYKKQWREAIKRLKDHNISCFIFFAANMSKSPYVSMYSLYKVEDTVFIRERLIHSENTNYHPYLSNEAINAQNCYEFIPPREHIEGVWEKSVALADIENFKVV